VSPRRLSLFIDAAPEEHGDVVSFWEAVAGHRLGARVSGARAPLLPPAGDTDRHHGRA
jgi:hypothetical protein